MIRKPYNYGEPHFEIGEVELKHFMCEGSYYYGEVKAGSNIKHGRGVMVFTDPSDPLLQEGWWRDDQLNSRGRSISPQVFFECSYESNSDIGTGLRVWSNGDKYEGGFKYNQMHGEGTFYYKSGAVYHGCRVNNLKHGPGLFFHTNGDVERGFWIQNKRHGQFIITSQDGLERTVTFSLGDL